MTPPLTSPVTLYHLMTPLDSHSLEDILVQRKKHFLSPSHAVFFNKTHYIQACAHSLLGEVLTHISYEAPAFLSPEDQHDILLDVMLTTAEVLTPYKKILKKILTRDIPQDLTLSPVLLKTSHTYWFKLLRSIHHPHAESSALMLLLCSTYTLYNWFDAYEGEDHYMQKVDETLKTLTAWKKNMGAFLGMHTLKL